MDTTRERLIGNTFINPPLDYILIGGAWSLVVCAYLIFRPVSALGFDLDMMWPVMLLANSSHFAASTVRLYSKPEFYREFSFLTFVFPALCFLVLGICIAFPSTLGKYLQLTYLLWSPFHYAKQIYGLSLMYTFRSGVKPDNKEKQLIYWVCMVPFVFAILAQAPSFLVLATSPDLLEALPVLNGVSPAATSLLLPLIFIAPTFLFVGMWRAKGRPLPLIVPLMMITNGIWWSIMPFLEAFVISTIAHSIQYLAIMLVYHVREQTANGQSEHGWFYHAAKFYGACILLGYALFNLWPYIFVFMGASYAQSAILCIAMINLHHFIVDGYVWRLRVPVNQVALVAKAKAA